MKITPISFDSFSTRSFCFMVEDKYDKILIDPGVAIAPKAFGLPPHEIELKELESKKKLIKDLLKKVNFAIITHYHYDHYLPDAEYPVETLFVKSNENFINKSQLNRSKEFLKDKDNYVFADGKTFEVGNFVIEFSKPVIHGDDKLGYVLMVNIRNDKSIVYTSDISGRLDDYIINWINSKNPDIIFLDGPAINFLGYRVSKSYIDSFNNYAKLLRGDIILDHHAVRRTTFRKYFNFKFKTGAEYFKKNENLYEARRKELYRLQQF